MESSPRGGRDITNFSGAMAAAHATDGITPWPDVPVEAAVEAAHDDSLDSVGTEGKVTADTNNEDALTEDDPPSLPGTGNSTNCSVSVSFIGFNKDEGYYNGPGTILYQGMSVFGFGWTVSGSDIGGGGIGHIGEDPNPENPRGQWTLDQFTSNFARVNEKPMRDDAGKPQNGGPAWRDINSQAFYRAPKNSSTFSLYDHPGYPGTGFGVYRNQSFLVKVYRGNEYCQVEFHFIQRGTTIHWGSGATGVWPK